MKGRHDRDAHAIGRLYARARAAIAENLRCLLECGQRLAAKHQELGHDNWLPWLEANVDVLGFGARTAQRLMAAAAKYDAFDAAATEVSREILGPRQSESGARQLGVRGLVHPAARA